jgi:hypothetical protein
LKNIIFHTNHTNLMKKLLTNTIVFAFLLFSPNCIFGQIANLGILESFEGFTGAGEVSHAGALWTGDVGTSAGVITGTYTGDIYNADASTAQARFDLMRLYIHLFDLFVDYPNTHTPAFGGGETITAGVYSVSTAGSITGTLTLDGGGNPNAFFIIKFNGSLTIAAGAVITLTGGTQPCNVFWIAEGAIPVGAGSIVKGTLFSHLGAIGLGINVDIEGRMLTMAGAITTGAGAIVNPPLTITTIPIFCEAGCIPAPAVDVLGSAADFGLFTNLGTVSNTSISGINGHIGTDGGGTLSGHISSIHIGTSNAADAITNQAKIDLDLAYTALMALPNTGTHTVAFGGGETLNPGVYSMPAAGGLTGVITLDGGGDSDAIFVMKFPGAFSVAASSKMILINGARRCNIFWISGAGVATGAITIGAASVLKGTFLAHGGSCGSGANTFLAGRQLSTAGAVTSNSGIFYNNPECVTSRSLNAPPLPIELLSFTAKVKDAHVHLNWITETETNNDYFNIERSADGINFTSIDEINGAGNSTQPVSYSTVDGAPLEGWSYYRLKQTDYSGKTSYSNIVAVEFNTMDDLVFRIYPNPFSAETTFRTTENLKSATLTVYNSYGHIVKQIKNISGQTITLHRDNIPSGVYFIRLAQNSILIATRKLVITD